MRDDPMLTQIEEHFHVLPLGEKSLAFGKILSTETSVKILEALYNCDTDVGLSASQISENLGVGRTTVIYHLGRMQENGLIQINPILQDDKSWNRFWDQYRQRNTGLSQDQFKSVHSARMNGIKLYVPTKKGFLLLPSTSIRESRSMVRDVLASISALAVEGDYQRMKKASTLLGTLGLLFIALSLAFQMPFLHSGFESPRAAVSLAGDTAKMEQLTESSAIEPSQPAMAPSQELDGQRSVEKTAAAPSSEDSIASDEARNQLKVSETKRASRASALLLYTGILLLGSFIGFLAFSIVRKRHAKL
ncbi:helix-turn-helix domain protein [archaeon BMS3Bbin16]|nr:helix-turn-helix domain protein [archaeon BMS3Bbin16]